MNSNLTSVQNSWLKNFFEINSFGEIISSDQLRIESSQRKFFRIKSSKNSLILMIVPPGIEESVSSFVTKGNYFHKYDVNVPQIYASDEDLGLILVEDFGDKIYQFNIEKAPDKFYELAINELIKIKGIGRWTAEMFLIFNLCRPDVFPVDDLGLIKGICNCYGLKYPISKENAVILSEKWKPFRSVATWYFWRSLDPIPVEY